MDHGWEERGIWIEARVARSFVNKAGSTVHGWVRWADGTYGSFQGDSTDDVTARFQTGASVSVLVDPADRLRTYRMALDASAGGSIDHSFAMPADEPEMAAKLLRTFSGVAAAGQTPEPPDSAAGPARTRRPRPSTPSWPPLGIGVVLLVIGLLLLRLFVAPGLTEAMLFPAAFGLMGVLLIASSLVPALAQARLRRTGLQVSATVVRCRRALASTGRGARFRWQVVAEATVAGQRRDLVSENLRDDPSAALPPGTVLTAFVDPNNPSRYRLLLTG